MTGSHGNHTYTSTVGVDTGVIVSGEISRFSTSSTAVGAVRRGSTVGGSVYNVDSFTHHRLGRSVDIPTPIDSAVLPAKTISSNQAERLRNQLNLRVKTNTLRDHVKKWNSWLTYASTNQYDLYLRTSETFQRVVVIGSFFCHLLDSGRSLNQIADTLRAMKFFFLQALQNIDFFSHELILQLKESAKPVGRSAFNSRQSRRKEPITFDMLKWIRDNYMSTVDSRMTYAGIALGYHFMLRASEFVYGTPHQEETDEVHALMYEDITILTTDGKTKSLPYVNDLDDSSISGLKFVVTTSKTDKSGQGRHLTLLREGVYQSQLVDDLVRHVRESKIHEGDVFMSRWKSTRCNNTNRKLTKRMVSTALKLAATAFGLDSCNFSPHSLRSGGATQLAASGANLNMIDRVGGWVNRSAGRAAGYQRSTTFDYGALGGIDSREQRRLSITNLSSTGRVD